MILNNPSSINVFAYNKNLELINNKPFNILKETAEFVFKF